MSTETALRARSQRLWAVIVLFNGLLFIWLVLKPGSHALVSCVDDIAQAFGPFLILLLCAVLAWRERRTGMLAPQPAHRWAPRFLLLGVLFYALGQCAWTIYEQILHDPPFPSWADAGFISAYPCLLAGILSLPTHRLPAAARVRLALDSVMIMTGIATGSWYFVLGPTLLQGSESLLGTVVGTAYPLFDLVLLSCIVLLAARRQDPALRPVTVLLALALCVIVATDSIFDYQQVHGTYTTGELLDVGWPLGYMLVALAAWTGRLALAAQAVAAAAAGEAAREDATREWLGRPPALWRALIPYAALPIVGVLLIYTRLVAGDPRLEAGVFCGAALLAVVVLLRQIAAMRETVLYAEQLHALSTNNSALAAANRQLEILATTDTLTSLPNRTLLLEHLGQALQTQLPVALLLMDLDRFKEVNDTLGHHYGDELLRQVSARLQKSGRAAALVARLGGDEFAVLLPSTTEAEALALAGVLLERIGQPVLIEGMSLEVGVSLGIALTAVPATAARTLLRQADVAMYTAKRLHCGYQLYDAATDVHSPQRLSLIGELRQVIMEEGLRLYYQPKVNLASDSLCGVEALVRWPHSEHGFIPPDQFIPLAEHSGLMVPLTDWVLHTALRQAQEWAQAGHTFGIAVNLSARALLDPHLPTTIAALLQRYGVLPQRLTLEITENVLMTDMTRAVEVLTRLSQVGVRLAIDDFGTGYSSLGYLKNLPVQEVKIDKSFVLGLSAHDTAGNAAIVCAVIGMARALGLEVVAEGIESAETLELLEMVGCDVGQGFYLSRPLPAAELAEWLGARKRRQQVVETVVQERPLWAVT